MRLEPRSTLVAALLVMGVGSDAHGQAGGGDPAENALFLLLPVGAKAVSLSRAMTAMGGPESVFWNPAGLGGLEGSQVALVRGDHYAGRATALSGLYVRPGVGTVGLSYFLLDVGEQELRDSDGNFLGTLTTRDHLGVVSVAAQPSEAIHLGGNLKVIQYRESCRGSAVGCNDAGSTATTYAIDAGAQGELGAWVRLGGMVANLGPGLPGQEGSLPWRGRLAVAYEVVHDLVQTEALQGWVTVEVQDRLRSPGTTSTFLGAELTAGTTDALFLRVGYGIGALDQDDGASVGLGLRYTGFDIAIAKSLAVSTFQGESEPVHVTLSYLF